MWFRLVFIGKRSHFPYWLFVFLLFTCSLPLPAQTGEGSITGSVTDQTGAVIPGASVTLTNTLTGLKTEATTTDNGTYVAPSLPVGSYSLVVTKPGFEAAKLTGIVVTAAQIATVNVTLAIGSTIQTLSVSANAEMVDTATAALGQAVNEQAIVGLPLNGRNPATLVFLSPGMANGSNVVASGAFYNQGHAADPSDTAASANGGREGSVYYLLDGANNMDPENLLGAAFPNADATQEFRVIENNFDAQYGFAPGAVVSIVTKSGTNAWHGDAFEFFRNHDLDAANFFTHETDSLKRNQYGGSLGGPIIKNKLFVYGNYQRTSESAIVSSTTDFVPNNAELNGDWSGLLTGNTENLCGTGGPSNLNFDTGQLFQPSVGTPYVCPSGSEYAGQTVKVKQPYPNNYIDPSTYNPVSVKIEASVPHTTAANGFVYLPAYSQADSYNEFTLRGDYNVNEKERVSGRVFRQGYNLPVQDGHGDLLAASASWIVPYTNYQGSWAWSVRPNLLNNFVASVGFTNSSSLSELVGSDGKPASLELYGSDVSEPLSQFPPGIEAFNVDGYFYYLGGTGWSAVINRRAISLSDSLNWTKGRHLVVAGVDVLRYNWTEGTDWLELPMVTFDGETTGNGASDFLTGSIDDFTQGAGEYNQTRQTSWAPFVQDTVRLKPNLTLNAGIRWEPYFPASITGGRIGVFRPGEQSTKYPNAPLGLLFPGDTGISDTGGVPSSLGEFSPRIGIAWQPRALPKTSIRTAFGIFIAPFENTYYHHEADTAPYAPTYSLTYVQDGLINLSNPWASSPGTGFQNPFPPFSSLSYVPPSNTQFALPVYVQDGFAPGFTLGKSQSWNFSIQHQFTPNTMLSVAYLGSETYHLPILIERNPGSFAAGGQRTGYPDFNSVLQNASWGTSSYHGLQISFEKRFSHGLQFTSNYTWSKSLDWSSAASTAFNGPIGDPFDLKWNYGISDMNFPQMWVTNFVWQTPALAGHARLLRSVAGSWQPTGIFSMESGAPFSIPGGCNGSDNSLSLIGGDRADLTGQPIQVRQGSEGHWLQQYFNPAAFACNAPGTFGNSPRNFLAGPPLVDMDLGIDKKFPFKEGYSFEFRWEMFNAFNTPHFGIPQTNPAGGGFGQIFSEAGSPRIMQAALKLYW